MRRGGHSKNYAKKEKEKKEKDEKKEKQLGFEMSW